MSEQEMLVGDEELTTTCKFRALGCEVSVAKSVGSYGKDGGSDKSLWRP